QAATEQARQDGLPEELHRPVLRVHYSWQLEDAFARINSVTRGLCWLFPDEIAPALAPSAELADDWESLEQALQESCDDEEIVAAGLQLLSCQDRSERGITAAVDALVEQRLQAARQAVCDTADVSITSTPTEASE